LGTIPHPQPASIKNHPNPDNLYHQSKWDAEELVRQYHSEQLQTIILRPTVTYGPGDDGFIYKLNNLIPKKRFVFPGRDIKMHLLNVHALAKLIQTIIQNDLFDGNAYLVADREPVILKDLVDLFSNKIYGQNYPGYMQIPSFVFTIAKKILKMLDNQQLLTSLQLISDNWTYNISETVDQLNYTPVHTLESI
jgi:nucleoside-diphosphate-sugar epimerase